MIDIIRKPIVLARIPCHTVRPADKNEAPVKKLEEFVTAENQKTEKRMEAESAMGNAYDGLSKI